MKIGDHYKGKVVIVTGGASGLGLDLAILLQKLGAKLVLASRSHDRLERAKSILGSPHDLLTVSADLSSFAGVEKMYNQTLDFFGRIDLLINNAAVSAVGSVESMGIETMEKLIRTNVLASIYSTKLCLSQLRQNRGGVFFISSLSGFIGIPNYAMYSSTKRSLVAFTDALRGELADSDVYVGIAHLGFLSNDKDKTILNSAGDPISVTTKPKWLELDRKKVASSIIKQIARSKYESTPGIYPFFYKWISVLFKPLASFLVRSKYRREM